MIEKKGTFYNKMKKKKKLCMTKNLIIKIEITKKVIFLMEPLKVIEFVHFCDLHERKK